MRFHYTDHKHGISITRRNSCDNRVRVDILEIAAQCRQPAMVPSISKIDKPNPATLHTTLDTTSESLVAHAGGRRLSGSANSRHAAAPPNVLRASQLRGWCRTSRPRSFSVGQCHDFQPQAVFRRLFPQPTGVHNVLGTRERVSRLPVVCTTTTGRTLGATS